jgi:hypothetical protein
VIVAGAAAAVAVLALVARPLLPHPTTRGSSPVPPATALVPASAVSLATSAATKAVACPPNRPPRRDTSCGTLLVSRRQASCSTDLSCRVELVGTLRTGAADIPIALTVTLTDDAPTRGWKTVEVTS